MGNMKKYITFAFMGIFLSGCIETVSLLGPMTSATNGKIAQSAVNSAINHGIKKKTGKSPLEHAVNYAEKKDRDKSEKNKIQKHCLSYLEETTCTALDKSLTKAQISIQKNSKIKNLD